MTELHYYTLNDIEKLLFDGIHYVLPNETIDVIKRLEKELKLSDTVTEMQSKKMTDHKSYDNNKGYIHDRKQPHTKKVESRYGGKYNNGHNNHVKELTNDDWETLRTFKTTKIEAKKGIEKNINDIRILLNKISNKNYEIQKKLIKESIVEFFKLNEEILKENEQEAQEDIQKLVGSIFGIISTNKFFSELYANLYKELMDSFGFFREKLTESIESYKQLIDNITFIDPNKDYDGFCANTKLNDNRKAMSQFIINMYKNGGLEVNMILTILQYLLNKSLFYIDTENKINEVEEITENIFILVSNSPSLLVNEIWKTEILPQIINISQMKIKEHKSLSNRVVFKYMDIIDSIE